MRIALMFLVIALLLSTVLLSGCVQSEPTLNIQATVQAAVATAVADQSEPTPSRAGTPMPVDVQTPEPAQQQPARLILFDLAANSMDGYGYGKLRDEFLNGELFNTLAEARILIEWWRKEYNQVRPHSALGYRPPAPRNIMSAMA